jgi:hypothetical protein
VTREQESKCCNINVDDIAKFECQSSGSEGYNQSPCLKSYIRWVVRRRFRHTQSSHTTPGASMITRFDIRCMRTDAWVGWSLMTLELHCMVIVLNGVWKHIMSITGPVIIDVHGVIKLWLVSGNCGRMWRDGGEIRTQSSWGPILGCRV